MLKHKRMVPIEVSTGSRKSQNKRMEVLKVRCGKKLPGTLVTGETIVRKASEFSSTRTETSTKECGRWTKNMGRVPTGEVRIANSGESTLAIGSKIKSTVEELSSSKTVIDMMGIGSMACHKAKEE